MRAYVAIVGGVPSKPQSLPSDRESNSNSPTGNPPLGGGTLPHLQAELGNLAKSCINYGDLSQEIALHELQAPPAILNQNLGENHQRAVILMWMTRSPFQEKEVGFPQDNHLHLLSQCSQMEGGFVRDHLLNPPKHAPLNPDMGCLINTLALGLCLDIPRRNTFSGKATPRKAEVSFEQWNHKVQCIKDHYPESVV